MIVLSTGSLYTHGIARVFELAAEVGFDGIEILVDHRPDTYHVDYLRRLSQGNEMPIAALHNPFGFVSAWPQGPLNYLQSTVAIAQELRVPLVVVHLPFRMYDVLVQWKGFLSGRLRLFWPWPRRGPFYRFLLDGSLEALEARSGVTVAIENMPKRQFLGVDMPLYWFNHPDQLLRFPHLTLDTTHIGTWGWDLMVVYEQLKSRVAHVHLSNFDGQEHRLPPDGRLSLDVLLHRLAQGGFQGAVSVECGPEVFHAEDENLCREALARTLAFCRHHYSIAPAS